MDLFGIDHVEELLHSGKWDDLARARTAYIASARCLSELSMKEEELPEEEYLLLAKGGADTGFQSAKLEALAASVSGEHDFIRGNLLERLESGLFLESEMEETGRMLKLHRDYITYLRESECLTTNYLLLTLGGRRQPRASGRSCRRGIRSFGRKIQSGAAEKPIWKTV